MLTYKSADTATFGAYTIDAETAGTIKFAFANNGTAVAANPALITVTFTINAGTAAGTYSNAVSVEREVADDVHHLKADGFFDANGDAVAVDITAGSVTVEEDAVDKLWGDVDKDGSVTASDAIAVVRYANNWEGYDDNNSAYDFSIADVDGDGSITASDAINIVRHANNWEGYETLPLAN